MSATPEDLEKARALHCHPRPISAIASALAAARAAGAEAARAETLRDVGQQVVVFGNRLQNQGFTSDMLPGAEAARREVVTAAPPTDRLGDAVALLREALALEERGFDDLGGRIGAFLASVDPPNKEDRR